LSITGAKRDDFIGEYGGAHRGEMDAGGEAMMPIFHSEAWARGEGL